MSTQTTPHQGFPAPCLRCGGALYQHADLCPYCGAAHPLGDLANARFAAAGPQHHPFETPAQADHAAPDLASPDTPIPPLGHPPYGSAIGARWLLTRGLIVVVVLLLAFGAYMLFGGFHSNTPTDGQEETQSTGGAIAPYTPGTSTSPSAAASVSASPRTLSSAPAQPGALNQATRLSATPPQAAIQAPPAPRYRDLADSLHAARTHRESNDLSGAQSAVNAAFAMQPDSADAQMIQHELTPLEQRRDAALQTAAVCIKDNLWNCVEHSASDALAIDSGSIEAKTLLARAIVQTGWTPLGNHAAAGVRAAPPAKAAATAPPLPTLPPLPAAPPAPAVTTAAAPNSVDAQQRAIEQFGWKNPATPGATPASGAPAAH